MCGIFVGSAVVHMDTIDVDSQSSLYNINDGSPKLRGAKTVEQNVDQDADASAPAKQSEAVKASWPVPLGNEAKALYLDSSNHKGVKLSSPYDFPSMTISAWINVPKATAISSTNTILGNKASGCEANAEHMGYALVLNSFGTSDRQLILEWGNEKSGCNKLASGEGEGHVIEFDKWTHVAATIDTNSATLYINGVQVRIWDMNLGFRECSEDSI
jgi:hypothetical protein